MTHSARTAVMVGVAVLAAGGPLAGQSASTKRSLQPPRWRFDAALATGTPYTRDKNGTTVRTVVSPVIGVGAEWTASPRSLFGLQSRIAAAPVTIQMSGTSVSGGTAFLTDISGGFEFIAGPRLRLFGALGTMFVHGPSDVAPFRYNNAARFHLMGETGASWRIGAARPWHLIIAAQFYQFGASKTDDPIKSPGTISRVILGVRRAR